MNILKKSTFILAFLLFAVGSCVKDNTVDFTQTNQIHLHQVINGSLISLNATIKDFGDINNIPFSGFDFSAPIDAFNNPTIQNNLIKLNFHFQFENTFNRDFGFTFNFLDANNVVVYTTTVNVLKKANTTQDVLVEGVDANKIKSTTSIAVSVAVLNSTTIDNTVGAFVSFTLGTTLYLTGNQQISKTLISLSATLPDLTLLDKNNLPFTHFEFDTPLDIFNVNEIKKNLSKAEVHFEITNTFNRDLKLLFEFLDINNQITYSIPIIVSKTSNKIHDELIEGGDLQNLIQSKKARVKVDVINANTIDNTPNAFINFKSSVKLTF
jgi:hypothetical protein